MMCIKGREFKRSSLIPELRLLGRHNASSNSLVGLGFFFLLLFLSGDTSYWSFGGYREKTVKPIPQKVGPTLVLNMTLYCLADRQ